MIQTPPQTGPLFLQLTLLHENVGWLHQDATVLGVEVVGDEEAPGVPAEWLNTRCRHADYTADHEAGRDLLLEAIQPLGRTNLKILELGGCCHPNAEVLRLPCDVFSVDIDMQTLQVGCLRQPMHPANVHYVCADANELPFVPGAFDCAVMFSTLHHFADPSTVLQKLTKLIKPDGFVAVLCEPVGHYYNGSCLDPGLLHELEQGLNEQTFVPSEYERIFQRAGLSSSKVVVDEGSLKAILRPGPAPRAEKRPLYRGPKPKPVWRRVAGSLVRRYRQAG